MRLTTAALLVCLSASNLSPCQSSAQGDTPDVFKVNVRLVQVYATVVNGKGHYVDGLTINDFEIVENGSSQKPSTLDVNSSSLSCAILLDTTGSMQQVLPTVKNSISRLIDGLRTDDAVALYTFDRQLTVRQDFTSDKAAAKRAVLRTRAEGATALFDALSEATLDVSKRNGKRAIVLFTDGNDNSSALSAAAAVNRAKKADVPIYTIAEGDAVQSPKLKKLLVRLSDETGASSYEVKKPEDIEPIFRQIAADLSHLYVVSYKPVIAPGDHSWHKIELHVKGQKDYKIRATGGYFPD